MTDWKRLSEAVEPPIPATQADVIAPRLEQLESALHVLVDPLPIDTLPWTSPTDK